MAQTPALLHADDDAIDFVTVAAVAAGEVVLLGSVPLISTHDVPAGGKGALAIEGQWKVPKTSDTFTAGDAVYWDTDGNPVVGTAGTGAADSSPSGNYLMGTAAADAASGDEYVVTILSSVKRVATVGGSVTADDVTGSDSSLAVAGSPAASGTAGAVVLAGGPGTAGNANGGALTIRGGAKNGSGVAGAIAIGDQDTASITFGVGPRFPVAAVAAAGSSQSDAAALSEGINVVSAADDTKGVKLPSAVAGMLVVVKSTVANKILKVYPNTSDAVNALSVNAAISLASGPTPAIFFASDATTWYSIPLLPS